MHRNGGGAKGGGGNGGGSDGGGDWRKEIAASSPALVSSNEPMVNSS